MAVSTIHNVLSFHVISQVGYMIMGLGLAVNAVGGQQQLAAGFWVGGRHSLSGPSHDRQDRAVDGWRRS